MSKSGEVIALESILGDDETDTRLLREMAEEAERYIRSFQWCLRLKEGFLTDGFGGVIAIFLFRVDIARLGNDQWIWVLVGDVPSAYLEMNHDYRTPQNVLQSYIDGITEWVKAVRTGQPLDGLIPINAPFEPDAIQALEIRADTLRQNFLPYISKSEFHHGSQFPQ